MNTKEQNGKGQIPDLGEHVESSLHTSSIMNYFLAMIVSSYFNKPQGMVAQKVMDPTRLGSGSLYGIKIATFLSQGLTLRMTVLPTYPTKVSLQARKRFQACR